MKIKKSSLTAVFIEEPEGGYSAYVEEIPVANSQGEILDEAKENLMDSLQMVLETNKILSQKSTVAGSKRYTESIHLSE